MPDSIENKLTAALGPVPAPAELWTRVDAATRPAAGRHWPNLVMAAALAALMSGGVLYLRAQQSSQSQFTAASIALHRQQPLAPSARQTYAVQRYTFEGEPVTVVSAAASGPLAPGKQVRTADFGNLAVSEWTSQGRHWAMVSAKSHHRQACSVCHRA